MSAADCEALLRTLYNRYNRRNPTAKASSQDWNLFHWETSAPVSLSIIYNGESSQKRIQVYGRPLLKRFLDDLATQGPGNEGAFDSDGSSFTFIFTAETALDTFDDFFDDDTPIPDPHGYYRDE